MMTEHGFRTLVHHNPVIIDGEHPWNGERGIVIGWQGDMLKVLLENGEEVFVLGPSEVTYDISRRHFSS